jgi:hypothetical protein
MYFYICETTSINLENMTKTSVLAYTPHTAPHNMPHNAPHNTPQNMPHNMPLPHSKLLITSLTMCLIMRLITCLIMRPKFLIMCLITCLIARQASQS